MLRFVERYLSFTCELIDRRDTVPCKPGNVGGCQHLFVRSAARWQPIRSDGADSRSPNSKRRPPNATCLPPSYRNSKAARPAIRNANTPASCFYSPIIVTAFRSSTWRCSRPPILNKWRTATISFTSGKRSNGRKVSNRFRSRSRLRSGN